jgi:hypothetical protein
MSTPLHSSQGEENSILQMVNWPLTGGEAAAVNEDAAIFDAACDLLLFAPIEAVRDYLRHTEGREAHIIFGDSLSAASHVTPSTSSISEAFALADIWGQVAAESTYLAVSNTSPGVDYGVPSDDVLSILAASNIGTGGPASMRWYSDIMDSGTSFRDQIFAQKFPAYHKVGPGLCAFVEPTEISTTVVDKLSRPSVFVAHSTPLVGDEAAARRLNYVLEEQTARVDGLNFGIINLLSFPHRNCAAERVIEEHLSDENWRKLKDFAQGWGEFFVIPASDLPYDGNKDTVATLIVSLLENLGCDPFGYRERDNAVDLLVAPVEGRESDLSQRSVFGAHIDHAWTTASWEPHDGNRPLGPDFVGLGGVWSEGHRRTLFANGPAILAARALEEPRTAYLLEKPCWSFRSPPSLGPPRIAKRLPMISCQPGIRANAHLISETAGTSSALSGLQDILNDDRYWTQVALDPGDIVIARGTTLRKRGDPFAGDRDLVAVYGRDRHAKAKVLSAAGLAWSQSEGSARRPPDKSAAALHRQGEAVGIGLRRDGTQLGSQFTTE